MFGPRRGSSVIGLVVFIVLWLAALAAVILGHNRLTGLSQEAKGKSLEEEMRKKKFDPQKETENVEELFHRRDTLRKEVALLGRQLGFGLEKAQVLEEAQFTTALNGAVEKLKEFQGATVREGLPKFETQNQKNLMSAGNLFDEDLKRGTNFFTKFDNLLLMLTERLVRYEDQLAYYAGLRQMAEQVTSRYARAESIVKGGLTRGDPAWRAAPEAAMDVAGKESYVAKVNELKAALEKSFVIDKSMGGQARTIAEAEARAVAQMTDYVIGTVNNKIAEYDGLISAEETKIDEAVAAFKQERNGLSTAIKNVVKERHRGRDLDGQIRILPPIEVSQVPGTTAPSMEEQASDGEIVVVSPDTREAYVNIGRENGVVEGMTFLVYRLEPQKQWHYRGKVQVKSVLPKMSVVSVVDEVSKFDPISAGDIVFNKIYSTEDPVRVVFLGEASQQQMARYNHLIERIGGVVETQVTVLTDFVILLPDYEKHNGSKNNVDRAKEIGVRGMSLDELRVYVEF